MLLVEMAGLTLFDLWGRGAISLTPRLQPGDHKVDCDSENRFNGFSGMRNLEKPLETVPRNSLGLKHRAEAAVLMRSLRAAIPVSSSGIIEDVE